MSGQFASKLLVLSIRSGGSLVMARSTRYQNRAGASDQRNCPEILHYVHLTGLVQRMRALRPSVL